MLPRFYALLAVFLTSVPMLISAQQSQSSGLCVGASQRIEANDDWQTVSDVAKGDLLEFTALGNWTYVAGAGHGSGPDGYEEPRPDAEPFRSQYAMPKARIGALIAKIGETGEVFLVGSSKALTAMASGKLLMRMNDITGKPADNAGHANVVYKICRFAS